MTAEPELLEAARSGDRQAYQDLVEPYHHELHAHCYRMLGSFHDAEDALQEALLRAWRGLPKFNQESSLRYWLYRIATNASLDVVSRRPDRVLEPYPDETLDQGLPSSQARYEQRESVELAFIAALQHLPARQRAALILREVLGYSAREVAEVLETTVVSVNSALQRARRTVHERLPAQSQQATLRALGDRRLSELVERYVAAWENSDIEAVVAMLAEDATFDMPHEEAGYRGLEAIKGFLADAALRERWRFVPVHANGQLAFGTYRWDADKGRFVAGGVDVITLDGERVTAVTVFLGLDAFRVLGLPAEL